MRSLCVEEDADSLHDGHDEVRGFGKHLDLRDVSLVERIQSLIGTLQRRQSLIQVPLGVIGDGLGIFSFDFGQSLILHHNFTHLRPKEDMFYL